MSNPARIVGVYIAAVVTWVYEGHLVVGVVVELPDGQWEHRAFYPEDYTPTPVPSSALSRLAPYLRVNGARHYRGGPDGTYPPGTPA